MQIHRLLASIVILLIPCVVLADDHVDVDADGDGYNAGTGLLSDCDDSDPAIHPWAVDACDDGVDSDCSGVDATVGADVDGDGFLAGGPGCGDGTDCQDGRGSVHPDAGETCGNGRDEDCSGADGSDDVDFDGDGQTADGVGCDGLDCDDGNPALQTLDIDGDGLDSCDGDCDDAEPLVFPGAEETCGDSLDNDCSGVIDDLDVDGDGASPVECGGADCNDTNAGLNPLDPEADASCLDRTDNDCDGLIDGSDDSCFEAPIVDAGTEQQDRYLGGTLVVVLDGGGSVDANYDDTLTYTWVLDTDVSTFPGVTATIVQDPASPIGFLQFAASPDAAATEWSFDLHLVVADNHGGTSDLDAPEARTTVTIARSLWVPPLGCNQGRGAHTLLGLLPLLALARRRAGS
jgi:hypothetical protein